MAGPLSGIGSQQIPLATTFQPGQQSANVQVRPEAESREAETNVVQPRESQAASVQNTETGNKDVIKAESSDSAPRGSLIDITV